MMMLGQIDAVPPEGRIFQCSRPAARICQPVTLRRLKFAFSSRAGRQLAHLSFAAADVVESIGNNANKSAPHTGWCCLRHNVGKNAFSIAATGAAAFEIQLRWSKYCKARKINNAYFQSRLWSKTSLMPEDIVNGWAISLVMLYRRKKPVTFNWCVRCSCSRIAMYNQRSELS